VSTLKANRRIKGKLIRAPKANNVEVEARTTETIQLLAAFTSPRDIKQHLATKYGISPDTANAYIAKARKALAASLAESQEEAIGQHLHARTELLRQANFNGDYKLSLEILKDMAKLQCLYAENKRDQSLATKAAEADLASLLSEVFTSSDKQNAPNKSIPRTTPLGSPTLETVIQATTTALAEDNEE
jgi:hypothetical protein